MSPPAYPEFRARFPWWGPDLQTLRNVLRGPALSLADLPAPTPLRLPMRDESGDTLVARFLPAPPDIPPRDGAPLVVLVHGLGGSADSAYIETSSAALLSQGYPVLQLNLRGAGDSRPHCRAQYHAGRSADLRDALLGLPADVTRDGVVVVGYSLGGNVTLKFAAEYGGLRGAVSISAPIDLAAASYRFLDARNRFYHAHLLGGMKTEIRSTPGGLAAQEETALASIRTILEFDEQIVAPRNGFKDAQDYYDQNHARQFLGEIQVPTLVIHALDDPWIPASSYTDYAWRRNPRLEPLLAPGGGHVGFHDQASRLPWHDRCLGRFLERL